MKRIKSFHKICSAMAILLATIFLFTSTTIAQAGPPLKASITFDQATFNLDDPNEKIDAVITLENISAGDVWTQEGFKDKGYHYFLYFKGPGTDGPLITWTSSSDGSPTPSVEPPTVNVEKLESGWLINMPVTVKDYYPLTKFGQYRCRFAMPFVQYDTNQVQPAVDDNGVIIPDKFVAPPGAVVWTDPIESNDTFITLTAEVVAVTSDVRVKAVEYIFGEGSHPGVTKKPLIDIDVRLYRLSAITAEGISPINHQTYGSIATNDNIFNIPADKTSISGEFIFKSVPHDPEGYLVLGHADRISDYKHLGRLVEADEPNWGNGEIFKKLILMTNEGGKKSPGKSKKLAGSVLMIIEPEYIEWSSNEEPYPFAFEGLGDWGVEVSLGPPEGFLANPPSLSESISSELEGIQFNITDIGSSWKPTKVKYKVKHKKMTQEIYSEIGVKLTKKLAKEKGVGEWGKDDQGEGQGDQGGKPKNDGKK